MDNEKDKDRFVHDYQSADPFLYDVLKENAKLNVNIQQKQKVCYGNDCEAIDLDSIFDVNMSSVNT